MQVRLSEHKDLEKIMSIFDEAKKFIVSYGSNQWQGDEYPSKGLIISDINSSSSYVLEDDEKNHVAELHLVDDDTSIITGELLQNLDEDLDSFMKDLMK